MAKMTRVVLHYTVQSGSSGASFEFDVSDEFFIKADNWMLNDGERGLHALMQFLLDCSARGGGRADGRAIYSNEVLEVFETRNMTPKREIAARHYTAALSEHSTHATSFAQAMEIATVDYRVDDLNKSELLDRKHELTKQFNKYRGLHRRDTNYDKLRNEELKVKRAAKRMQFLLENRDGSGASIRESEEYKKVLARRDKAVARLEHLKVMRTRNVEMQKVYKEEIRKIEATTAAMKRQEREHEREKARRVKARVDDMRKRHALYRTGQRPTRPADLNKTQAQIEAEVEKELQHEHRLKHDSEYAAEYHSEQQAIQQAEERSAIQRAQEFMRRRNGEGGSTPQN